MASVVREQELRLNSHHLLFWSQAFAYRDGAAVQSLDTSFADPLFDAVNVHPLPNISLGGRTYQLGRFMGKELRLHDMRDFCAAAAARSRPCSLDEDNSASLYRDIDGWTIHRKRAWVAVLSGCHYDYIDFSILAGQESGTAASRAAIRAWMQHLSTFVHARDLENARPHVDWLAEIPRPVVSVTFGVADREYLAYLADPRELGEPGYGEMLSGSATFNLPAGDFELATFSPTSGATSPWIRIAGGRSSIGLPSFQHDIVLIARRRINHDRSDDETSVR
jgi:hypothetical protein